MAHRTRLQQAQDAIAVQDATGQTTAQQIEAFLATRIAERTAQGLVLTTTRADGSTFTCYPKDETTKVRWRTAQTRQLQ